MQNHVLVAAYACNPLRGSEEAVGWNWVQTIARSRRVTVLTAAYHEADIRSACDPEANPRFVFVPHRWWHYRPTGLWRKIEHSLAKPIMNLAYAAWQRDAHTVAKQLVWTEHFDLAHQLTYVGFRFPGRLWQLGLPFVWGPIGGLENTPWRLLPAMGVKGGIYFAARNLVNSAQRRWLRSPRKAIAAAGPGVIAATAVIAREIAAVYRADSSIISEVVAPLELSPVTPLPRNPGAHLRVVWTGLHLPGKALNLLIEAIANLPADAAIELHILGNGPMHRTWQKLAERLGIEHRCVWYGQLPRQDALKVMAESHVLAITSLNDLTSTVLLEGLALGLPVCCPDLCGFSGVVTEDCGIKVAASSGPEIAEKIGEALLHLSRNEGARLEMAQAAIVRAREFGADSLQAKLDAIYSKVLSVAKNSASGGVEKGE